MSNLTFNQKISMVVAVLGVLTVSSAQLTDIFGPDAAKIITSVSGLLTSILSGIVAVFTGQANLVKDVQAMPGVEKIVVNRQANQTLASLAVDPNQDKVEIKPADQSTVIRTAQA